MLDGTQATTIQQVQTILQKVERCKNLEKRTEKKKENSQKSFKNNDSKGKKSGKYTNPCKKVGHDHEWDDCPDNWKNKKKSGNDKQEKHIIKKVKTKSKKVSFHETDEQIMSLIDEKSLWSNDSNENYSTNLADPKNENEIIGEVLLSVSVNSARKNVVALLDSGTSQSLLNRTLADENVTIKSKRPVRWETKAGEFSTMQQVVLKGCKLPQFTSHRKFEGTFHFVVLQVRLEYNDNKECLKY